MDSSPTPVSGNKLAWPSYDEVGADVIGDVIDGRFEVVRRLAKGGMADVFLSKDPTRKCYVAIKLLRTSNAESRRRFAVEAEVLSNIQHPHVIRAIAFGLTPDARPYMALEYLAGEPLSQRLARGPLPWRDVAEIGVQIAGALQALHAAGVVHRDIKPDNIILTTDGERAVAKLIDLGLASVGTPFHDLQDARFTPEPPLRHKTQIGRAIGTPAYLPPEAGLCDAEPRLDIYSLGATLYQLCTQLLPKPAGGRSLRDVRPATDAPDDLSRLLRAALEPDPSERLPTADHLRRGLEAILAAHPRTANPRHLFGGSYDRLEVIGVGANAIVYRASDRWLSREVAVKVLRDAEPSGDDAHRFRRAAKILSALRHPNIPRILHFGIDAGQAFVVTELCAGSPATYFVGPDKHLRPDEVLAVGRQLASALAAVHAIGVVYRDLHPGNVLIARGEAIHAWIFDFDHSAVSPAFYARLTERWATPPEQQAEPANEKPLQRMDYASPEVRGGAAFSAASDVYALGLLLYRLLTGLRPFPPEGGEPIPARKVCPACPINLERLLLSMLNPGPTTRPTLTAVEAALADEQAERDAEAEDERTAAQLVDATPRPISPSRPEPAIPTATEQSLESALGAGTVVSSGSRAVNPAPSAAPLRRRLAPVGVVFVLILTATTSLLLGRASVSQEGTHAAAPLQSNLHTTHPSERMPEPTLSHGATSMVELEAPPPALLPSAPEPPPTSEGTAAIAERDISPPSPPILALKPPPSRQTSRPPRREPVTTEEATRATQRVLPALRACEGTPGTLTADIDIVRGRGTVLALNSHPLSPTAPGQPWHDCVQRHLERVRFPSSESAGRTRIRLTLR